MSETRLRRRARREYAWRLLGQSHRQRAHPRLARHLFLDLCAVLGNDQREARNIQRVINELGESQ